MPVHSLKHGVNEVEVLLGHNSDLRFASAGSAMAAN